MGKPAARVGDMHVCPMATPGTPPIPHVGGPILPPGKPTVLIGGMPAATMGSMCTCVGPPDSIILGSVGVMIGGQPAARMGDQCAHGGMITVGCPTVLIGEVGMGSVGPFSGGSKALSKMLLQPAFSKASAVVSTQLSRLNALLNGAAEGEAYVHKHNVEDCKVQYEITDSDGKPAKGLKYEINTSDGKVTKGKTDGNGKTIQLIGYTEGMCTISFPE
jgi:uncharacterized Zn-binding protein involved in type VI secretion